MHNSSRIDFVESVFDICTICMLLSSIVTKINWFIFILEFNFFCFFFCWKRRFFSSLASRSMCSDQLEGFVTLSLLLGTIRRAAFLTVCMCGCTCIVLFHNTMLCTYYMLIVYFFRAQWAMLLLWLCLSVVYVTLPFVLCISICISICIWHHVAIILWFLWFPAWLVSQSIIPTIQRRSELST